MDSQTSAAPETALAAYSPSQPSVVPAADEWGQMVKVANALAKARGFIPSHFNGDAYKVLAAIMYGRDLGFTATMALQHIIMVEGKATLDAQAVAMLIRKAGHKLRDETTDAGSTVTIIRKDDPEHPVTATFTMADAQRAGLARPGSAWTKYPRAMVYARALTEAARKGAQDALMGVIYTPEELGADVSEDGRPVGQAYITGPEPTLIEADMATGEIKPADATPAAREIIDNAEAKPEPTIPANGSATGSAEVAPGSGDSGSATSQPETVASPAPSTDTSQGRARRGVGPTAKRTNVVQMPGAAPEVGAGRPEKRPTESEPEPQEQGDESGTGLVGVAVEPLSDSSPVEEPPLFGDDPEPVEAPQLTVADVDLARWRYLARETAARLWVFRVRHQNRKAALLGEAPMPEPEPEPNADADAAMQVFIAQTFPGRTFESLDEADLTNLNEDLEKFITQMVAFEAKQAAAQAEAN